MNERGGEEAPGGLVDSREKLAALGRELAAAPVLGVDTELNSFFAYKERVCLLQVSTAAADHLVDPLALADFSPLGPIFADPERVKVLHDGEQDLQVLQRDLGLELAGIFDTKVAFAALENRSVGLANLVRERFGVELDKKCQRSDWGRRPLAPEQLAYARLDTRYLLPLHEELAPRLAAADPIRRELAAMEFRRLERLGPAPVREGKEGFARLKGAGRLRPRERRRLAELYGERERLARARDLPPGRLLPDATLVALARVPWPVAAGRLEEACGLPRRSLRRQRSWVMKALERAADRPPIEERGGEGERPDRTTLAVREKIRGWRRNRARQLGVDSSLLLNRGMMDELARRRPAEPEQLAAMEGLEPWWVERFGGELLALIAAED